MTTIIRRKRVSRSEIGPYKRHELLTGVAVHAVRGYSGYTDGVDTNVENFISDEMRFDWQENRKELLAFWRSGECTDVFSDHKPWLFVCGDPRALPWAAKMFDRDDEPEPRRGRRPAPKPRPLT